MTMGRPPTSGNGCGGKSKSSSTLPVPMSTYHEHSAVFHTTALGGLRHVCRSPWGARASEWIDCIDIRQHDWHHHAHGDGIRSTGNTLWPSMHMVRSSTIHLLGIYLQRALFVLYRSASECNLSHHKKWEEWIRSIVAEICIFHQHPGFTSVSCLRKVFLTFQWLKCTCQQLCDLQRDRFCYHSKNSFWKCRFKHT